MGSLGDRDDEIQPGKRNSILDRCDNNETQPLDSQSSPPSPYGEENEGEDLDELDFLQSTLPFVDTAPLEDAFETQVLNFAGETQVLDDPEVVENVGTQLLDESDNEVVVDTDDEGVYITQVLGDTEELFDDDFPLDEENKLFSTPGKQDNQGLRAETDDLTDIQNISGSVRADFTSVRTAALRASGLAARRRASKGTNNESCTTKVDDVCKELHIAEDNGITTVRDSSTVREEVYEVDFPGVNEQINGLRDKSNCRAGSSTVRRLFTEDTLKESKEPYDSLNNADGNEIAGLSYVDSQEPGELSQANALEFVERFIKFDVMEFGQEDELRRPTEGKSKLVSSAKGTQSLVKRTNLEFTARKRGVFDWDDSREDEGGGKFFTKKKESFFDTGGQRKISSPRKSSVIPNFGLRLHSSKSYNTEKVMEKKSKKKLTKKVGEQLNIGSSDGTEATQADKDVPEMLNIGVDTQIAAEAMEALCFGLDVVERDSNETDQGAKNRCEGSDRGEKMKRSQSKEGGVWKASSSPGPGDICRNSKKRKSISSTSRKKSAVSSRKQAENITEECETEVVKEALKKSKSNGEGCFGTNWIKNIDKVSSEALEQIEEERAQKRKDTDEVDTCHVIASSNGCVSVKKRRLEDKFGTFTPIARRTRQCRVPNQLKAGELKNVNLIEQEKSHEKFNDMTAAFTKGALGYNRGKRTSRKLSTKSIGSGDLHASVSQSVVQGTNGQSLGRLTRRSINASSTCVDLANKRRASSDRQSDGNLFQHSIDKRCSRNAALKCSSVDQNVIPNNAEASTHLEVSPEDRHKPSGSASTTPLNLHQNLYTPTMKDSRRRRDMASVQALFSHHLDEDIIKQQKKILARLGASIASSISEATHYVTDKFVRTRNMLQAIAFGKPVVTHLWLESCGQASCFIDERNYIVRDAKKEKEFGFSLPVSLARACQRPLLQGQKVLITPNTKPGKEILANLVRAVHGLAVERVGRSALKGDNIPDDLLVLSCEEDYATCMPFLERGAAVYSSELLLNGIVTQKLEFERLNSIAAMNPCLLGMYLGLGFV
ncbi:hypothetical protein C3L33_14889, partial [Rhododendron williamsianum]